MNLFENTDKSVESLKFEETLYFSINIFCTDYFGVFKLIFRINLHPTDKYNQSFYFFSLMYKLVFFLLLSLLSKLN